MTSAEISYSATERAMLWASAVICAVGLNGVFIYGTLVRPELLASAMTNPVAAAFIIEALMLMGMLAYLLDKWKVSRLHWGWFVALTLSGGLAFALPVVLLWTRGVSRAGQPDQAA